MSYGRIEPPSKQAYDVLYDMWQKALTAASSSARAATIRALKAEEVLRFYADLDYDRSEASPREYHSMYDTRSEKSDAEKESGAKARAYFEDLKTKETDEEAR